MTRFPCGHPRTQSNTAPYQTHGRRSTRCRRCRNVYQRRLMRRRRRLRTYGVEL